MQLGLPAPEGSLTPTETCGRIAARQGPRGLAQCRAGSSESTRGCSWVFPALRSRPWLVSWPVGAMQGLAMACVPPPRLRAELQRPCALWVAESRDASDGPSACGLGENQMTEM